jgi:hypothetical protein
LTVTDQQNKKERIKMKSKTKNNKVPKSAKTRLSDLTPKKDARAGKQYPAAPGPGPAPTPPIFNPPPSASSAVKKQVTL